MEELYILKIRGGNMKRIVLLVLIFMQLTLFGCANTSIDRNSTMKGEGDIDSTNFTSEKGFDYDIQDNYINIIKCLNYGMNIAISEQIDGKSVKVIGEEAFYQHTDMISVSIPESIISIGQSAFYRCYSLEKITIPKNVEQIGANPFFRCSSLTQIIVDPENKNFTELDGILFNKDKSVLLVYPEGKTNESFTIPNSVKKIDGSAFGYRCEKLKTIIIPPNVIDFPDYNMFVFPEQITLKVKSGSAAEQYCKSNDLKCEIY